MKSIGSKNCARILVIMALAGVWIFATAPARDAQQNRNANPIDKPIQLFFEANCYGCHNSELKSGGLNLEQYKTTAAVTAEREIWEQVLQKVRTGEMPPKGTPRPNADELRVVIGWIEQEMDRADRLVKPDPGRVTARRLNRVEYDNTVRDLLGVDFRPADDFPQDDSGYGFDNIGDVLSVSPVLMEKYLSASEKIARTSLFGPASVKPVLIRLQAPGRRIVPTQTPLFDYDQTGLNLPNALHVTHRFPVSGEYVFRTILGGVRPGGSAPFQLALWIDGHQTQTGEIDPEAEASFDQDRQDLGGKVREFRAKIPAGEHWIAVSIPRLYEGLPSKYGGPAPSTRKEPPQPQFRTPPGAPPERIAELRKQFDERRAERLAANDARISAIEVGGPYAQETGPSLESLKKIFVCGHLDGHHQTGCPRRIVNNLARRAYRRPVTNGEIEPLLRLVSSAQKNGESFNEGLGLAVQAILVSPHFLFRIETDANRSRATLNQGAHVISQHALASRLSYFLWSSMPDNELRRSADQGTLQNPVVLERQVRRMLKDPKTRALVENFGGQWLELRKLESVKPDRQRFPEFEEYLRMSMREETELFFDDLVRQDRSILNFIDADYTFLNERLARFYRIPGVTGTNFRRVNLNGTERGGVLTHASVLTVSSYATRTSPVLRGKWILENILNSPQPPAPPGVPNLDEAKVGSASSLRQQLEEHRKDATCASCHVRMDPLGFGLENFDAIGAWRTQDGKLPIDASGTLPDGRSFKGPAELKTIVKGDRDAFAEGLAEKMLTYALGRGLERYDRPTVKKIARSVAAGDYRFSRLILEIVSSLPFQQRRGT